MKKITWFTILAWFAVLCLTDVRVCKAQTDQKQDSGVVKKDIKAPDCTIQTISNSPLSLTIGGGVAWSGNPEGKIPPVKYRLAKRKPPAKMFTGVHFLGQDLNNGGYEPIAVSPNGGEVDMGKDLAFITFIFKAGKGSGQNYTPENYTISAALFEAVPDSKPNTYKYGSRYLTP